MKMNKLAKKLVTLVTASAIIVSTSILCFASSDTEENVSFPAGWTTVYVDYGVNGSTGYVNMHSGDVCDFSVDVKAIDQYNISRQLSGSANQTTSVSYSARSITMEPMAKIHGPVWAASDTGATTRTITRQFLYIYG